MPHLARNAITNSSKFCQLNFKTYICCMYLQLAENEPPQLAGFFKNLKKLSLKKIVKGAVGAVKKVGLALPRNAYNGLVALNFKGIATKLKRAIDADPNRVKAKWESLGGNFADLKKVVATGAKKKHLFEMEEDGTETGHIVLSENGDGIRIQELSTPAVPAAIATAAPIIAALAPLLKQFTQKGDEPEGATSVEDQAAQLSPDTFNDPTKPENAAMYDTEKGVNITKSGGISTQTLLIGAAAIAAVVLLTRKK